VRLIVTVCQWVRAMTCLRNEGFVHAVQGALQVSQGACGGRVRFFEKILLDVGCCVVVMIAASAHAAPRFLVDDRGRHKATG
jgi:hypothetical protein